MTFPFSPLSPCTANVIDAVHGKGEEGKWTGIPRNSPSTVIHILGPLLSFYYIFSIVGAHPFIKSLYYIGPQTMKR